MGIIAKLFGKSGRASDAALPFDEIEIEMLLSNKIIHKLQIIIENKMIPIFAGMESIIEDITKKYYIENPDGSIIPLFPCGILVCP